MDSAFEQARLMLGDLQFGLGMVLDNKIYAEEEVSSTYLRDQEIRVGPPRDDVINPNRENLEYTVLLEMIVMKIIQDSNPRFVASVLISAFLVAGSLLVVKKHKQWKYRLPEGYEKPKGCKTEMERMLIDKLWKADIAIITLSDMLEDGSSKGREYTLTAHLEEEDCDFWSIVKRQERLMGWYKAAYFRERKSPEQTENTLALSEQKENELIKLMMGHLKEILPSMVPKDVQGDQ